MPLLESSCTFCTVMKWKERADLGKDHRRNKSLLWVKSQRQGDSLSISMAECFFTSICLSVQLLPLTQSIGEIGMLRVRHMKIWGRKECYDVFFISYLSATSSESINCTFSLVSRMTTGNVSESGWLHLGLPFALVISYASISVVKPFRTPIACGAITFLSLP